ncbi:MAG: CHAT domain-containing protein [Rhodopirellula sp.]|nr:CHAT domain-containing protein [Rhodopirellula sp.]
MPRNIDGFAAALSLRNRSSLSIVIVVVAWYQAVASSENSAKFEQAVAAVSKIKGLDLAVEQRGKLLTRWFQFGGMVARQQCNAALAESDFATAEEWADKEYQLASECLEPTEKLRIASLMNLAKVRFLQQDRWDLALETFAATATQARTGKHVDFEIEALMGSAVILLARDANDLKPIATLLKAAQMATPQSPLYANSILFVWNRVWFPAYQQAGRSSDSQTSSLKALTAKLDRIADALTVEGVDLLQATAGRLLLPRLALDSLDLETARIILKELDTPPRLDVMPAFWRVQLLSLKARLATELSLFAEARNHLVLALETAAASNLEEQVAVLQISLGELLIRQGDYTAAEEVLRDTIELYEKHPRLQNDPQRPIALSDLARTYEGRGRYSRAEDLYEEAIALVSQQTPDDTMRIAMIRNNQAANFYMAGQFETSLELFQTVLKSLQSRLGPDHQRVAEVYANLGWLAMETGNASLARNHWKTSLDGVQRAVGDEHPRVAEIMSYLGRAEAMLGNTQEATNLLATALDLREQHLERTMRSALSERDRLAIVQELRVHPESAAWPGVFDTWLELAEILKTPAAQQYERVLRWKGTLDRFHIGTTEMAGVAPDLLARRADVLAQLRTAYFGGSSNLSRRARQELVTTLETEANALEREIRETANIAVGVDDVSIVDLKAKLPAGAALLDVIQIRRYSRRETGEEVQDSREYVGFLLVGQQPVHRINFGSVEAFDKVALAFYEDVSSGNPDYAQTGAKLTQLIRVPLEAALADVDTLIVSGDGLFHMLPLGALPGKEANTVWLDELAFASVGNPRELLDHSEQHSDGKSLPELTALVVGGVEYGERQPDIARRNWSHLPGTQKEADAIVAQLGTAIGQKQVTSVSGKSATETNITDQLHKSQLVHLATHGFFGGSSRKPGDAFEVLDITAEMDSAIVLAGANTPPDEEDELLTAEELGNQNLKHVRLLVLSACQTGLGHVRAGQGVVGLLGALGRAGVHSIVSSLWEVNDEATAKLMAAFYAELSQDSSELGLARSLRRAQLKLRRGEIKPDGGGSFTHPRFWAPFFLSGSSQGIQLKPNP